MNRAWVKLLNLVFSPATPRTTSRILLIGQLACSSILIFGLVAMFLIIRKYDKLAGDSSGQTTFMVILPIMLSGSLLGWRKNSSNKSTCFPPEKK